MSKDTSPSIRFINTFEPVVPLYDDVFPLLEKRGVTPRALVSASRYRETNRGDENPNLEILRFPFKSSNKRLGALLYALLAPLRLLLKKAEVNVFLTQPPLFFIMGAILSKLTRTPFIIHIMDLYPDLLARAGILKPEGWIYKMLRGMALWALNSADKIFVIGRCMQDHLVSLGVREEKIDLVPNWGSKAITPLNTKDNPFRKQHGLEGKFLVMYSGNMGTAHSFDTILAASKRLRHHQDVIFVFIGGGVRRQEIEACIRSGQENLRLLEYQPYDMLPFSLGAADVHFMSLREGFEGLVVPSKIYGILASGRPVIYEGERSGEVARVILEAPCGLVTPLGEVEALEKALLTYLENPLLRKTHGHNAYSVYEESYHPDIGAERYATALLSLLQPPLESHHELSPEKT